MLPWIPGFFAMGMLRSLLFSLPLVLIALACGVSQESLPSSSEPEPIGFEITKAIDDGFEGPDEVEVQTTMGEIEEVQLYVSTDGGLSYDRYEMLAGSANGLFEVTVDVEAYPTNWYIGAKGFSGAVAAIGSLQDPMKAQKYLTKESADEAIRLRMVELVSADNLITYFPGRDGGTYEYSFLRVLENETVTQELDHYVDSQNADQHAKYAIEYSPLLDDNGLPVSGNTTAIYDALAIEALQDLGYIIISSANTDSLKEVLRNPDFFPEVVNGRRFLTRINY